MLLKVKILLKYVFLATIFLFLDSEFALLSAPVATIKSVEFPGEKQIYYGPILDKEVAVLNFRFTSYELDKTFLFYSIAPTFIVTSYPDISIDDKAHFDTLYPAAFPFSLNFSQPTKDLAVKFSTLAAPMASYGRKEAMLVLGLVSPEDISTNVIADTFYLIGKKTNLFVDWYDEILNFDTVLIARDSPVTLKLNAKNTTTFDINATSLIYNLVSKKLNDDEFSVENKQFPLTFYSGNNLVYRTWDFSYKPLDLLPDTAEVFLLFKPFPSQEPARVDTAKLKLVATGATHSLDIQNADCNYNLDTIDIGNVRVGGSKTAKIVLQNHGNINYGLVSQNVFDEISDSIITYFSPARLFLADENHKNKLPAGDSASFEITFSPDRKGTFLARYVLENDFAKRKIHSSSQKDHKKTFILRGTGVIPTLVLPSDTINFGNISHSNSSENCLTTKDTTIQIYNTGNATLIISDIYSDNETIFRTAVSEITIPPNSAANLKITFSATYPEKTTAANLFFVTNQIQEKISLILIGTSVPPIKANLAIPHLANKPGTLLHVPILLTNNDNYMLSNYIKTYSFDIFFNSHLLEFVNFDKIGTASEACEVETLAGNSSVKVNAGGQYSEFSAKDTLLILTFRTFLGNSSSTGLTFQNAKVGNGNCEDFIELNEIYGSYSIDSICGLEYKLQTDSLAGFRFEVNAENSELSVDFTVPYQISSNIELLNSFGEKVSAEAYPSLAGVWHKKISIANLPAGVYFCKFSSGLYVKIVPIIVQK